MQELLAFDYLDWHTHGPTICLSSRTVFDVDPFDADAHRDTVSATVNSVESVAISTVRLLLEPCCHPPPPRWLTYSPPLSSTRSLAGTRGRAANSRLGTERRSRARPRPANNGATGSSAYASIVGRWAICRRRSLPALPTSRG